MQSTLAMGLTNTVTMKMKCIRTVALKLWFPKWVPLSPRGGGYDRRGSDIKRSREGERGDGKTYVEDTITLQRNNKSMFLMTLKETIKQKYK